MDTRFISNKPWVDETIKLRKALFFTTIFTVILGAILAILGIVLLAYMEFVVGVIAIVFGILIPLGYVGANVLLFAKRRKDYDKNMIVEYHFTDDAIEIIKLSDSYKSKDVIDYTNLRINKVYNRSRFIVIKTKSYYSDYIVLRKSDIKIEDGENKSQKIASFVSFLLAKVAEANRVQDTTCADLAENIDSIENTQENEENIDSDEISGLNIENTTVNSENADLGDDAEYEKYLANNAEQGIMTLEMRGEENDAQNVDFEDLTISDDNVDIEDEKDSDEVETTHTDFEVVEEELGDDVKEEEDVQDSGDDRDFEKALDELEDSEEPSEEAEESLENVEDATDASYDDLFNYDEKLVDNSDTNEGYKEPKKTFFEDYNKNND